MSGRREEGREDKRNKTYWKTQIREARAHKKLINQVTSYPHILPQKRCYPLLSLYCYTTGLESCMSCLGLTDFHPIPTAALGLTFFCTLFSPSAVTWTKFAIWTGGLQHLACLGPSTLASAQYKYSSVWMMLFKLKQDSSSCNTQHMGQTCTGWWHPWQWGCSRQVNGCKSQRLWKKTTGSEKSVTMIRCEDNFYYIKITARSISSSVNLEKREKVLHYEK